MEKIDIAILVKKLNEAAEAYYNGEEIMSNFEYDKLYDELVKAENETGIVLANSPTQRAGYEVVPELKKIKHEFPALSLAKTKDINEYQQKFKDYIYSEDHTNWDNRIISYFVVLEWKLDGSTVVATYDDGKLTCLATRGNGEVGSDITHNARNIKGLPLKIDYKGHLVVRGEAVMSYSEFERINETLPAEERYKNPRNLANASISMLDSKEMSKREIWFNAFELVCKNDSKYDKVNHNECRLFIEGMPSSFWDSLRWLQEYGFNVVERAYIHVCNLKETMEMWEKRAETYDFPVDGLVTVMDDEWFWKDLQGTAHNPHIMHGFAFKWADETEETTLRDIEWSPSRTGLLNPVAVFDPVELEGTTVTRASLHNISYILSLNLKVGDKITVYKANKIIPQIAENLSHHEEVSIKDFKNIKCPVCKETISVEETVGAVKSFVAKCSNQNCTAKKIGAFVHFCERDCMNIVGMSEETISKFATVGIIKEFKDFYTLSNHPEIAEMEGFGEKSYKKLIDAAKKSKNEYTFIDLIHAMGIPNIGKGQAKLLAAAIEKWAGEHPENSNAYIDVLLKMYSDFNFESIDGFGEVIVESLKTWIVNNIKPDSEFMNLLKVLPALSVEKKDKTDKKTLNGKTFVITGDLVSYKNRDELIAEIESFGGKVSGSVSSKTSYLINNDIESTSGKNKKAKELNIPIITENDFINMKKGE